MNVFDAMIPLWMKDKLEKNNIHCTHYYVCQNDINKSSSLKNEYDRKIQIPDGCVGISKECFSQVNTLEEVVIPESVKYIDDYAFSRTMIKSITIPKSIERLGNGIFDNCMFLRTIKFPSERKDLIHDFPASCQIDYY